VLNALREVTDYDNANRTEAVPSRLLVLVAAPWVSVRSIFVIIFASALDARPRYGEVAAMQTNRTHEELSPSARAAA
jgi:hypothetical protein